MKARNMFILTLALMLVTGLLNIVWAAERAEHDTEALAKASQNPVASLISVPFENNYTINNGTENSVVNTLNIKPVLPMSFGKNWNLINRTIIPVVYQEERFRGENHRFGLGDITYQGFFSPKKAGKLIWGIGPQLGLPTGMDRLTSNQWTLGPSAVVLAMPGHWVVGALVSQVWDFGGGYEPSQDVKFTSIQYFINYNMKGGWYLTSTPTITKNWKAEDSDDKWTVPFGGGVGRVFKIGKQHVNMRAGGFYNVQKPQYASDWNFQVQLTFLFPK